MKRTTYCWSICLGLGLVLLALPAIRARDDEDEEEKKATLEAGEALKKYIEGMKDRKEADVKKDAEAMLKKHGLDHVMYQFKPRARGFGLGVGPVPGKIQPDGIDIKIKDLAENKPTADDLKQNADAYQRMMTVSAAIAEIAGYATPPKAAPATPPGAWKAFNDDMKKGVKELADAFKSGKPDLVQKKALDLSASCSGLVGR
jgi:hypothetical protein